MDMKANASFFIAMRALQEAHKSNRQLELKADSIEQRIGQLHDYLQSNLWDKVVLDEFTSKIIELEKENNSLKQDLAEIRTYIKNQPKPKDGKDGINGKDGQTVDKAEIIQFVLKKVEEAETKRDKLDVRSSEKFKGKFEKVINKYYA